MTDLDELLNGADVELKTLGEALGKRFFLEAHQSKQFP